jgi:lipopolysaccharide transport system ATP-binding protein
MSSDVAIQVDALGKRYPLVRRPSDRLVQALLHRPPAAEVVALHDVSFAVARGETVGVVGRNGSGKSTLLEILAGTQRPTTGKRVVNGRVAPLLDLGAGFDPEFTGSENIRMSAAILGLTRETLAARYDDIVAFAEIGEFLDRPVKTYSTGMYLRLAFAVAVAVEPDVLLVDEILSVGDVRFQAKCIERMREIQRHGTTIVLVSHAPEIVRRFCGRCLWLDGGRLVLDGDATAVTDRYADAMQPMNGNGAGPAPIFAGQGSLARIRGVELSSDTLAVGEPLRVTVDYDILDGGLRSFLLGVALYTPDRRYIFGPNTALDGVEVPSTPGSHRVVYAIPRLPLLGGAYVVDAGLFLDRGLVCLDYRSEAARFVVTTPYVAEGLVHIEHRWEICE